MTGGKPLNHRVAWRAAPLLALAAWPAALSAQAAQPGWWEVETHISAVDGPAPMVAQLKGRKQSARRCLSAAEAARGPQDMMRDSPGCKLVRYTRKAGKIDGQMVCKSPQETLTTTTTGTFTATSFASTARIVQTGAQRMSMTVETNAKRTGACTK